MLRRCTLTEDLLRIAMAGRFFFPHSILYRNQSDEYIFQFFSSVAQQPEMIAPAKPCLADWT